MEGRGSRTLHPAAQLERFEIPAERVGLFELEIDAWAAETPEPWPFHGLYWERQVELQPVSGGAVLRGPVVRGPVVRGRVRRHAVGALAHFQAPPGDYVLFVRFEPQPEARQPGGAAGLARHQSGLSYVGPVTVTIDGSRGRVALEPGSSIGGEIVVQGEPRLTSLHVPAELHLPSGTVVRVAFQPSDTHRESGTGPSPSAPFELYGLPPGARVVLSRGQASPSPFVVPPAGSHLDGVRITVPPR